MQEQIKENGRNNPYKGNSKAIKKITSKQFRLQQRRLLEDAYTKIKFKGWSL